MRKKKEEEEEQLFFVSVHSFSNLSCTFGGGISSEGEVVCSLCKNEEGEQDNQAAIGG